MNTLASVSVMTSCLHLPDSFGTNSSRSRFRRASFASCLKYFAKQIRVLLDEGLKKGMWDYSAMMPLVAQPRTGQNGNP